MGHIPPEPENLEIIVEVAVKHGYLNKEWLEKFFHTGRYPSPEYLKVKLFPQAPGQLLEGGCIVYQQ